MWLASRSVIFEGMAFQVCDPADQLLHIFAHAVSDLDPRFMRWIADATFVIRGAPDLAWRRFVEQARDHRLSIFCVDALVLLRQLVNLPIPTDTMSQLKRQSSTSERVERFSLRWNASPGVGRMTRVFLDLADFAGGKVICSDATPLPHWGHGSRRRQERKRHEMRCCARCTIGLDCRVRCERLWRTNRGLRTRRYRSFRRLGNRSTRARGRTIRVRSWLVNRRAGGALDCRELCHHRVAYRWR